MCHMFRSYSKHKGQRGYFQARRRVLGCGLTATLILRLLFPRYAKCRARALAATEHLPMQIYRGLMLQSDDGDPSAFVDSHGYRFRTLFNHYHTRIEHVTDTGIVMYSGGSKISEYASKDLPDGWEVCPPDDVSIAVCTDYSWQGTGLMLSDGKKHATLGCCCAACACGTKPRRPHLQNNESELWSFSEDKCSNISNRRLIVRGADYLIRRPLIPVPFSSVSRADA